MHNYNVQVSFQKTFSMVFFLKPFNPHIHSVFLPLKMICMCYFGSFHTKICFFFVLFFSSGSNLYLILYKCVILCLFFFCYL